MAFFDNLSSKAKTFSETSSLNGVIKTEEKKIREQYLYIGKLYFEKFSGDPGSEFSESVALIKESQKKISEAQKSIELLQARNKCPKCGAEYKPGSGFCSSCGTALPSNNTPVQSNRICSKCGNVLPSTAVFCNACGNKLGNSEPQPVPEPMPVPQPVPEPTPVPQPVPEPTPVPQPVPEPMPVPQPMSEPVPTVEPTAKTEEVPRFCKNCGSKAESDDIFCDNCGTKL